MRRRFPHALLAVLGALLACAPTSGAALPEPTWLTPEAVTSSGVLGGSDAVSVKMAADGGVLAGWNVHVGGHQELRARYRATNGSWSPDTALSTPGVDASNPAWIAASNGDILIVWPENDGGWKLKGRTLRAGGQWTDPEVIGSDANGASLAQDAAGNIYLSYSQGQVHLRVRSAGSSDWSTASDETIAGSHDASETHVAVTPDGEATVTWTTAMRLYAASRAASESSWSGPQPISETPVPDNLGMAQLTATDDGRVVATWVQAVGPDFPHYVLSVKAAVRDSAGAWGAPQPLGADGAFMPMVATNGEDVVLTWLDQSDPSGMGSHAASLAAGAGEFSAFRQNPEGELAATIGLAARPDGSIYAGMVHGTDFGHGLPGSIGRSPSGAWGPLQSPDTEFILPTAGGGLSSDDNGNLALAWGRGDGTVMVAVGDGAGPRISDVSVPATATVGDTVPVSASAADRFSSVASTGITFGDGEATSGLSAEHAYSSPGTYTVTMTATDTVGNTSTVTRGITVSDPPAPPSDDEAGDTPKPPVVIAPVIEARLAGKTLALNARVTLKPGQKCKGTITVTTAFGGKTYKAPAKLALKNGACRATAQITLKKTPSLRTKLRVTVGATKADRKKLSPRTITSRRG